MTNAQTEARAIATRYFSEGSVFCRQLQGDIAAALEAKEAELAEVKAYSIELLHRKDEQFERAERAEAALAETRKALGFYAERETYRSRSGMGSPISKDNFGDRARRALTGGQEDGQ